MKKRILFKWIFCLLGGMMFFACSNEHEEVMGDDISSDDIQIIDGILVFPSHDVLSRVINGEEGSYTNYVSMFKSQKQMFEEIVTAESKQMDHLDKLSGKDLEKAAKHTSLYEAALKDGLIKEVFYSDGTSSYDYNLVVPYYSSVINKDGFFAVKDTLYQITSDYVRMWVGANIEKRNMLANYISSDKEKNIFVFDYSMSYDVTGEYVNSLSRISFPAPPTAFEKGMYVKYAPKGRRFTITYVDKIGFALPNYTRDIYINFTSQRLINGTSSYGYSEIAFDIECGLKTQTEGVVSDYYTLYASGVGSNTSHTINLDFGVLIEGKTQLVTDSPYVYILYARPVFGVDIEITYFGGFVAERSTIKDHYLVTLFDDDRFEVESGWIGAE